MYKDSALGIKGLIILSEYLSSFGLNKFTYDTKDTTIYNKQRNRIKKHLHIEIRKEMKYTLLLNNIYTFKFLCVCMYAVYYAFCPLCFVLT